MTSLKETTHAIAWLVEKVIAAPAPTTAAVDHLLILADALDELAQEQYNSGLTHSSRESKAQAKRLRAAADTRAKPQEPDHGN